MTPLHLVRDSHIAKLLIENGADVYSRDSNVSMDNVEKNAQFKR